MTVVDRNKCFLDFSPFLFFVYLVVMNLLVCREMINMNDIPRKNSRVLCFAFRVETDHEKSRNKQVHEYID